MITDDPKHVNDWNSDFFKIFDFAELFEWSPQASVEWRGLSHGNGASHR